MKLILALVIIIGALTTHAQTNFEKSIPMKPGQKLVINADDPAIKIQTWDKNEVWIKGTVSINQGENDSAFGTEVNVAGGEVAVTALLKDRENIPHRIIIKKDDREYFFKTSNMNDPKFRSSLSKWTGIFLHVDGNYKRHQAGDLCSEKHGRLIYAKYGLIEVKNFSAPLTIDSKYGGVDASFAPAATGEITARCRHGEVLTNLDIKFNETARDKSNKWTEITAKPGSGPRYSFESKYGNIYLRNR
ncbi:MAG: hypothetical protein WDN75_04295 [Bacteroidota bacterium]